jgi:imidazolonepropionase-like amidohydrolase
MSDQVLLKNGNLWNVGIRDILVEGGRIQAVAENLSAQGAEVIDLTAKTVLPGFINAHVHLYGVQGPLPDELIQRFVTGGCTTVRDMGMTSTLDFSDYMEWLSTRKGPEFPEVFTSGKFLCGENTYGAVHPSGAKIGYVIDETPEAARAAVDAMVDAGAQQIKTGQDYGMDPAHPLPYLPDEVFQAICQQAKARGVHSSAHITKRDQFVRAAQLGLTEGAHTPTNLLTDEDIAAVAQSGMFFNTTASIFDMVSAKSGEDIMNAVISNLGRLYRAGVPMSVGTDFMHEGAPYQTAGIPVHELQLLVKAGLTVNQAVQAATLDTAKVMGVGDRLGSIEPGKQADIIAIDSAIDETFAALTPEHVTFVMHRGTVIQK